MEKEEAMDDVSSFFGSLSIRTDELRKIKSGSE